MLRNHPTPLLLGVLAVSVLVAIGMALTLSARLLAGDKFTSPLVLSSAVVGVMGLAFVVGSVLQIVRRPEMRSYRSSTSINALEGMPYVYVRNNPMNHTDLTGLASCTKQAVDFLLDVASV